MRFKVKNGKSFDLEVTVKQESDFSFKKAVTIVLVAALFFSVVAAAVYGFFTGDYSALKAIAEAGKAAFEKVFQVAVANMK